MKPAQPQAAHLSLVGGTQTTQHSSPASILRAILGNLQDGFIIANQAGEIQQINLPAERICNLIHAGKHVVNAKDDTHCLPAELWQVCRTVLNQKDVLSVKQVGLDADIILPKIGTVRIRVQNVSIAEVPHLLIVLEDRQQTIRNKALSDAALYGLTERETEIWQMRLRGDAYKDISTKLWISVDTVKKHVKNILAKQRGHQDNMEYALMA